MEIESETKKSDRKAIISSEDTIEKASTGRKLKVGLAIIQEAYPLFHSFRAFLRPAGSLLEGGGRGEIETQRKGEG